VRPRSSSRRRAAWTALVLLIAAMTHRANAASSPQAPPVKRYILRAEIVRLPDGPDAYLTLRHEAVDDFTNETGEVVGMDSMVMPFPVEKKVSLAGLAVGDKIEVIMAIDWSEGYLLLERVRKLPPSTKLHFGKARKGGQSPPADPGREERP
jgi:Cu/Ag efflux protein CusF